MLARTHCSFFAQIFCNIPPNQAPLAIPQPDDDSSGGLGMPSGKKVFWILVLLSGSGAIRSVLIHRGRRSLGRGRHASQVEQLMRRARRPCRVGWKGWRASYVLSVSFFAAFGITYGVTKSLTPFQHQRFAKGSMSINLISLRLLTSIQAA